jgi:hypothetical protein
MIIYGQVRSALSVDKELKSHKISGILWPVLDLMLGRNQVHYYVCEFPGKQWLQMAGHGLWGLHSTGVLKLTEKTQDDGNFPGYNHCCEPYLGRSLTGIQEAF